MSNTYQFLTMPNGHLERQTTFDFKPQCGDGNILNYIATIKSVASHQSNPNEPIQLCRVHSNQFICALCDKFYSAK